MAVTNFERVGKAMELLRQGLAPFVEREVQDKSRLELVRMAAIRRFVDDPNLANKPISDWDVAWLLKLTWETRSRPCRSSPSRSATTASSAASARSARRRRCRTTGSCKVGPRL